MSTADPHAEPGDVDVSVVAVSWNTAGSLPLALDRVPAACGRLRWETIVVDNGSSDGSPRLLGERTDVRLVRLPDNTGFTAAANLGAAGARGRFLLFLNPDVLLPEGGVATLVDALEHDPAAWAATPWFRNPDGTPQLFWRRAPTAVSAALCFTHRGRRVDGLLGGRAHRRHRYGDLADPPGVLPIDGVGAACLLVRRDEFERAGRFDERYFNFFQDTDLMRRMRRTGRHVLGVGTVEVQHGLGITFRTLPPAEVHGQLLYGLRQYLAGEPAHRRLVGSLAVRLESLGRPDVARIALAPL